MRFHIIRNARIENVGKYQSCMVSNLRIIWKQTVGARRNGGRGRRADGSRWAARRRWRCRLCMHGVAPTSSSQKSGKSSNAPPPLVAVAARCWQRCVCHAHRVARLRCTWIIRLLVHDRRGRTHAVAATPVVAAANRFRGLPSWRAQIIVRFRSCSLPIGQATALIAIQL